MKKYFLSIMIIVSFANIAVPLYGMNEKFNNLIHTEIKLDEQPYQFHTNDIFDKMDVIRMANLGISNSLNTKQDFFRVESAIYYNEDGTEGDWRKLACYRNSMPILVEQSALLSGSIRNEKNMQKLSEYSFPSVLPKSIIDDLNKGKMIFFETGKEWVVALSIKDKQINDSSWIVYDKDGKRNERFFSKEFNQGVSKIRGIPKVSNHEQYELSGPMKLLFEKDALLKNKDIDFPVWKE